MRFPNWLLYSIFSSTIMDNIVVYYIAAKTLVLQVFLNLT